MTRTAISCERIAAEARRTRNEYEHDKHGRITQHGKFEAEMIYVPYYWSEGYENPVHVALDDDDRALFPELGDKRELWLYEDEQGFVSEISDDAAVDIMAAQELMELEDRED